MNKYAMAGLGLCLLALGMATSHADDYSETTYYVYVCNVNVEDENSYYGKTVAVRVSNILKAGYDNDNGMDDKAYYFLTNHEAPKPSNRLELKADDPDYGCYVKSADSIDAVIDGLDTKARYFRSGDYEIVPGASTDDEFFYDAQEEIDIAPYLEQQYDG